MSQFLTEKRKLGNAGYFRIGDVTLTIPPEEIVTNKIVNNQELSPLRSRYAMYQKTGLSRWDVTISWKALLSWNADDTPDYSEFETVQRILAMFVAAPFVEIENAHLRQFVADNDPGFLAGDRMSFALRQLRVDTLGDIVDGLQITLTLSLFNSRPYSTDFSYRGQDDGERVSAGQSDDFSAYLNEWVTSNLKNPRILRNYPGLIPWADQAPGTLTFKWREYRSIPKVGGQIDYAADPSSRQLVLTVPKNSGNMTLADAIARFEGWGGKGKDGGPNLGTRNNNPGNIRFGARIARLFPNSGAATGYLHFDSPKIGWSALNYLVGTTYSGLTLRQIIKKYAPPSENDTARYTQIVSQWTGCAPDAVPTNLFSVNGDRPSAVQQSIAAATPKPPVSSTQQPWYTPSETAKINAALLSQADVTALGQNGWIVDHETDRAAFVYRTHELTLSDMEHGADSQRNRLYTTQLSILFVNQLPAIPLEAYSIATYQHVGACATRVSISLLSDGDMQEDGEGNPLEPDHEGLSELAGAVSLLENQFHAMKLQWRSVTSVQRMQSLVVENQILNMLGIYAVIPEALQTTTLPDSPTLVQANLQCSQYENVFEQLSPYQVKGIGTYDDVWQQEVFSNSKDFQEHAANNPLLKPLQKVVGEMEKRDIDALFQYLKDNPKLPSISTNVPLTIPEQKMLLKELPNLKSLFPDLGAKVEKDWSLNFNDVLALAYASRDENIDRWWRAYLKKIEKAITPPNHSPDPVAQLYHAYIAYSVVNNRGLSTAVGQIEADEQFEKKLKNQVNPGGPGKDAGNLDHVAYRDLGLYNLDDQPASYFFDDAAVWTRALQNSARKGAEAAVKTMNLFNRNASSASVQSNDAQLNPTQDTDTQTKQVEAILRRTLVPSSSMRRAFPTFKLFLIEDSNLKTYYMFDDFYSYASVLNIEIIRYQNKPDTAVIQLSNIANLLTHKLYDQSIEGRYEFKNSPDPVQPVSTDGPIVNLPGQPTKEAVGKTNGGYTYQYNKLQPGFDDSGRRVPLQYFALQTGTKIQVRMGYTNNPDELSPVFSGVVTQIEDGAVMTLTAQGFGVELIDPDPSFIDKTVGGFIFTSGGGEAVNVMGRMLESDRAKHFGHWQVAVPGNNDDMLLRGWTHNVLPALGDLVGAEQGSSLLRTSYDRARENLLVDHHYLPNGSYAAGFSSRDFQIERSWFWKPVTYSVPDDPTITPWMIIQDVKRRYPEFSVFVKLYGYPFSCDATLVYASPNSFYIARPALSPKSELTHLSKDDAVEFRSWWVLNRERFKNAVSTVQLPIPFLGEDAAEFWARRIDYADDQPGAFNTAINNLKGVAASGLSVLQPLSLFNKVDLSYFNLVHRGVASLENVQKEFEAMRSSAIMAVQYHKNPASTFKASNRILPVRKWILVTSENIIKNNIVLNDQFYNAVRVADETFTANKGMDNTTGNTKLIDRDPQIVDVENNVDKIGQGMRNRYAQSFLRDELQKMYRGELHLTGLPEADPGDILLLVDRSTGMMGPIEIESIIHSFDQEMGYISIVKPAALVALNEAMTTGIMDGMWQMLAALPSEAAGFVNFQTDHPGAITAGAVGTAGVGAVGYGVTLAAGGTLQAVGGAIATGAGTVATALGITAATFVSLPALAIYGALAIGGAAVVTSYRQKMNPLLLHPLSRFGQPWVAGVDGWSLTDLSSTLDQKWTRLVTYDLDPYLQLAREAMGLQDENAVPWTDRSISLLGDG